MLCSNLDADDNISWVPRAGNAPKAGTNRSYTEWGPARALRLSYRHTFNRLHEALHLKQPPVRPLRPQPLRDDHSFAFKDRLMPSPWRRARRR